MDFKISPASLDRIETADHTFKITTNSDATDLALSISAIGLLQPPVLIQVGGGYRVVSGFRRIAAWQAHNLTRIPVRTIPPDTSGIECAQIAIADNAFQRPLNVVEQSRAFALIRKFTDDSNSWLKIAKSTGLPASQTAMDRIIPVAGMPVSLQDAIVDGDIALPVALHLNRLNNNDAIALCGFFRKITTGLNVQRELLALISEISLRDDISITSLMAQDDIAAVMGNDASPTPQKVQQLRLMLKAKRYPELVKAETTYHQTLKSLQLDPRIQLHPPPFFEGKAYRLTLTVDSRRELSALQTELKKLVHHPNLLPE